MTDDLKRESTLFVNLGKAAASGRFADKMALRAVAQNMSDHIAKLQAALDEAQRDAKLGRVAMQYVDRAADPDDSCDPAETILSEFSGAMQATISGHRSYMKHQP